MLLKNLKEELDKENTSGRGRSFDYCYGYFRSFYDDNSTAELASEENIEKSCLEVGMYLASWGMYRGSSSLLRETSVKHYEKLIKAISSPESKGYWKIDADTYTEENKAKLLECASLVRNALWLNNISRPSDTLVTKVMLGVFGNTPAFDTYFKGGMKKEGLKVGFFNKKSLEKIRNFYINHKAELEHVRPKIKTLNFLTGEESRIVYPIARLIDLDCWLKGRDSTSS